MGKKVIALIILAVAAIVLFVYYFTTQEDKEPVTGGEELQETVLPEATGDIDDIVDALLQESLDEESALEGSEEDIDILTSDSQEVDDFGQSANENEF